MKKSELINSINKYHLNGLNDRVLWTIQNNKIIVKFSSLDKSLIGKLKIPNVNVDDCVFGIFSTADLLRMMTALKEDISFKVEIQEDTYASIKMDDGVVYVKCNVADPDIIKNAGIPLTLPDFDIVISLTTEFVNTMIKSITALPSAIRVGINSANNNIDFIVGYSRNNLNSIQFSSEIESDAVIEGMTFSAEYLKNIFLVNKDMKDGVWKISTRGLSAIAFKSKNNDVVQYYLMPLKEEI